MHCLMYFNHAEINCFNDDYMKVATNEPRVINHGVVKIYRYKVVCLVTYPGT